MLPDTEEKSDQVLGEMRRGSQFKATSNSSCCSDIRSEEFSLFKRTNRQTIKKKKIFEKNAKKKRECEKKNAFEQKKTQFF